MVTRGWPAISEEAGIRMLSTMLRLSKLRRTPDMKAWSTLSSGKQDCFNLHMHLWPLCRHLQWVLPCYHLYLLWLLHVDTKLVSAIQNTKGLPIFELIFPGLSVSKQVWNMFNGMKLILFCDTGL